MKSFLKGCAVGVIHLFLLGTALYSPSKGIVTYVSVGVLTLLATFAYFYFGKKSIAEGLKFEGVLLIVGGICMFYLAIAFVVLL